MKDNLTISDRCCNNVSVSVDNEDSDRKPLKVNKKNKFAF